MGILPFPFFLFSTASILELYEQLFYTLINLFRFIHLFLKEGSKDKVQLLGKKEK